MKKDKKLLGAGILTAVASSLCCITPILALISGTTGIASSFNWLAPFRPYFIIFTILVLGFAWYNKLKPKKEISCNCAERKPSFVQSKLFLAIVTVFACTMTIFPYFSNMFYPKLEKKIVMVNPINIQTKTIEINGMTCSSCEKHIEYAINQLTGILNVKPSYEKGNAIIQFDTTKITIRKIENEINLTGYSVVNTN